MHFSVNAVQWTSRVARKSDTNTAPTDITARTRTVVHTIDRTPTSLSARACVVRPSIRPSVRPSVRPSGVRPSVRPSVPHFLVVILQLLISFLEIYEIVAFPIRSEPQNLVFSSKIAAFQIRSEPQTCNTLLIGKATISPISK